MGIVFEAGWVQWDFGRGGSMNEILNQRIQAVRAGKDITHAQIVAKQNLREELETEMEKFLANGGEPKTLERGQCMTFRSPCFDKSKSELQALAKQFKRKTFAYWCDSHGIGQFKTKDGQCVRCGVKA